MRRRNGVSTFKVKQFNRVLFTKCIKKEQFFAIAYQLKYDRPNPSIYSKLAAVASWNRVVPPSYFESSYLNAEAESQRRNIIIYFC